MSMSTMSGTDIILFVNCSARTCCDCFLTNVQMSQTSHLTEFVKLKNFFFKSTNFIHCCIKLFGTLLCHFSHAICPSFFFNSLFIFLAQFENFLAPTCICLRRCKMHASFLNRSKSEKNGLFSGFFTTASHLWSISFWNPANFFEFFANQFSKNSRMLLL